MSLLLYDIPSVAIKDVFLSSMYVFDGMICFIVKMVIILRYLLSNYVTILFKYACSCLIVAYLNRVVYKMKNSERLDIWPNKTFTMVEISHKSLVSLEP